MSRRSKIEESLERCIERMREGATLEECLAWFPDQAEELRPLLHTTQAVHGALRPEPSDEAKASGRDRLEEAIARGYALQRHAPRSKAHRRRVEDALDACIERMKLGASLDVCLAEHPAEAEELRPLLETVQSMQGGLRPEPRAAARAAGRARVEAEMARRRSKTGWSPIGVAAHLRVWAATATAIVVFAGGFGVVRASSDSLPGDTLYGVKRTVERVQLSWPLRSDESKARFSEHLARRRTNELIRLSAHGEPEVLTKLSEKVERNLDRATNLTIKQADEDFVAVDIAAVEEIAKVGRELAAVERDILQVQSQPVAEPAGEPSGESAQVPAIDEETTKRLESIDHRQEQLMKQLERLKEQRDALAERRAGLDRDFTQSAARLRVALDEAPARNKPQILTAIQRLKHKYEANVQRFDDKLAEGDALLEKRTVEVRNASQKVQEFKAAVAARAQARQNPPRRDAAESDAGDQRPADVPSQRPADTQDQRSADAQGTSVDTSGDGTSRGRRNRADTRRTPAVVESTATSTPAADRDDAPPSRRTRGGAASRDRQRNDASPARPAVSDSPIPTRERGDTRARVVQSRNGARVIAAPQQRRSSSLGADGETRNRDLPPAESREDEVPSREGRRGRSPS